MHADDKSRPGLNLDEARKNAERYFGADGITLDAIRRFLADQGSAPLPDFGKLLKIALELPNDDALSKGWEQLLRNEDLSSLIERPREYTEKYGIDTDAVKTRLEAFQSRLDEEGALQFPDPAALTHLILTMAQHLTGNSEALPMSDLEETIQRNEEIIRNNEALLGQIDTLMAERDQLLEQHGISAEAVTRFIDSQYVSPEDRERIRQETSKVQEEIAARASQIENEQVLEAKSGLAKKPRMRSMV